MGDIFIHEKEVGGSPDEGNGKHRGSEYLNGSDSEGSMNDNALWEHKKRGWIRVELGQITEKMSKLYSGSKKKLLKVYDLENTKVFMKIGQVLLQTP